MTQLGTNITQEIKGDKLILTIDLKARNGQSSSGKSTIVATTSGNQAIGDTGVMIGLNCYVKNVK